jgi:hypothetical protein
MLVIREIFTAKPGQASKLAALFKKAMAGFGDYRIMTDAIGEFNTVVMETEVESLAEYERQMKEYQAGDMMKKMDKETAAAMSKYTEMYVTGRREVYRVI